MVNIKMFIPEGPKNKKSQKRETNKQQAAPSVLARNLCRFGKINQYYHFIVGKT